MVNRMCAINPRATPHPHKHISRHTNTYRKCWKIQRAACGVLKTACPRCSGQGGPERPLRYQGCVSAGKKDAKTTTRKQTQCTHKHYCVSAQRLYADCLSHRTTGRQFCLYTHKHSLNRNTSDAWEGERLARVFDQFDRLPSWDSNRAHFLVNVFAFLPGRRLYIDTTGLFLGAVNLAHIQYPRHFGVELKLNIRRSWAKPIMMHC